MVTTDFSRKGTGNPVMLWIHNSPGDHMSPLSALRQYGEVLIVASIDTAADVISLQLQ